VGATIGLGADQRPAAEPVPVAVLVSGSNVRALRGRLEEELVGVEAAGAIQALHPLRPSSSQRFGDNRALGCVRGA
jgi:hypothetical protein